MLLKVHQNSLIDIYNAKVLFRKDNVIKLRKSRKGIRSMIKGSKHTPDRIYQKKAQRKDRS